MLRGLPHLMLLFVACASTSPGQFSPATPQAPSSIAGDQMATARSDGGAPEREPSASAAVAPDRGAEGELTEARRRFDAGDHGGARAALEALVARHPDQPIRADADILLARLALGRGDPAAAKRALDPLVAGGTDTDTARVAGATMGSATIGRYYLGLAESRLGNSTRARALLLPFLTQGASGDPTSGDDAAIELRGALAEATAPADPIAALELWEIYLRIAREHEKAWARGRASEVSLAIAPETAWRAYGAAPPSGLARAVLGIKAATYLRSRGDAAGATFIETESNAARRALGFDLAGPHVGPGDPTRIGLAIPLSGKFQVVGEAALRAAMLAGSAPALSLGLDGSVQLLVRDTATDSERAARGVAELTRTEAVIGIVGAASSKTGTAAIAQATQDGIAVLALEDVAPGALTTAFQIVHAPETRAAALARHALKLGVRRFALVGPDSNSGKRLKDAFRKAVTAGGGTVVVDSTYVAGATSFTGAIAPLKRVSIEAIFVPDSAERLPLIAPALAVADLWPQPWGKPRTPATSAASAKAQPRSILLLSTANELSRKLVDSAGRYVQGALLCPGFFADENDPHARGFVEAYRAAYGSDPHATEAYAYDAVATLRAVTQRGARTRGETVKALSVPGGVPVLQGLTGDVTFGPDHGRVDVPRIYFVDGDDIRVLR
jgi:branched-chain amino acid transport system substrate-binding protein